MNEKLVLQLAKLAVTLAETVIRRIPASQTPTAAILEILRKAGELYRQQTGQALDPSLIHAENNV
jgi:hypothetical protein